MTLRPFVCLLTLCLALVSPPAGSVFAAEPVQQVPKKGLGLSEKHGMTAQQMKDLNVGWYYNWSDTSQYSKVLPFVPMIFSIKKISSQVRADYLLGFNEPDHKDQSNITVAEALANWQSLRPRAKFIGSPSMAGNPVTGDWLPVFMKAKPAVDFICVHWYKGADSKKFINDMEATYQFYKKPIWVTEFAPQTDESTQSNPDKYSQAEVDSFIKETTQWMEQTPYMQRYAWHSPRGGKLGTSCLFDASGALTATGKTYAHAGR